MAEHMSETHCQISAYLLKNVRLESGQNRILVGHLGPRRPLKSTLIQI
jgi:hypothetical protein